MIFNHNAAQLDERIINYDALSKTSGSCASYIIMLVTRLRLLLLKDSSMKDKVVNIRCYINRIMYKDTPTFFKCKNERFVFLSLSSNDLHERVSCSKVHSGSGSNTREIFIFDGQEIVINLGAILTFMSSMIPLYDNEEDTGNVFKNDSSLRDKIYNVQADDINDYVYLIKNDRNVICKMPELTSVENCCKSKLDAIDYNLRDNDLVSWFEPYNPSNRKSYKEQALSILSEYNNYVYELRNQESIQETPKRRPTRRPRLAKKGRNIT